MAYGNIAELPPVPKVSEVERLYAAWRHAKGKWDMESYAPEYVEHGLPDSVADAHCNAVCAALNAYLLHPTACPKDLARKLRVIKDEQIFDGWHNAAEIVDRICADAHRMAFGAD